MKRSVTLRYLVSTAYAKKRECRFAHLVLMLLLVHLSWGQHIYVKPDANGSGVSWDDPTGEIPTGSFAAGTQIFIAQGNYTVSSEIFLQEDRILIQGGFPLSATGHDTSGYNPSRNLTRITAVNTCWVFHAGFTTTEDSANQIEIKGITFTGGTGHGGLFYSCMGNGNYRFTDVTAKDMSVTSGVINMHNLSSGGIFIHNCNFQDNAAKEDGAVLHISADHNKVTVNISHSVFARNNSGGHGGAIYIDSMDDTPDAVTIRECSFSGNNSGKCGGAVYAKKSKIRIVRSLFSNNSSPNFGGALYALESNLCMESNRFYGNQGGHRRSVYDQEYVSSYISTIRGDVFYWNCTVR